MVYVFVEGLCWRLCSWRGHPGTPGGSSSSVEAEDRDKRGPREAQRGLSGDKRGAPVEAPGTRQRGPSGDPGEP